MTNNEIATKMAIKLRAELVLINAEYDAAVQRGRELFHRAALQSTGFDSCLGANAASVAGDLAKLTGRRTATVSALNTVETMLAFAAEV